jgi:hypothetical protein
MMLRGKLLEMGMLLCPQFPEVQIKMNYSKDVRSKLKQVLYQKHGDD